MSGDHPIRYIERTRGYYAALGYAEPYEWARFDEVPFHPLQKPLARCRIALVTTAAPYQPGKGDQGPRAPYNARAKFYAVYSGDSAGDPDLRIAHVAIDRTHTSMGSRLLRQWLRAPLRDIEHITARQSAVGALLESTAALSAVVESLDGICDIERIVARIAVNRASPRDLSALGRCLD
jgi:hypothetical protein